ncbi:zinc-binding dehydrogenase [Candidatus Gracilibacteria bacterium]|nr:zinc-binding dehydrogenase [Candidatus Gracilibacteria bacterium]NJM86987.1 zinc-binding dehydrogenase [Hydrococcus sp. RU_2_2]NJP18846.1 zinc-binding dehydrogenase [Hydrococcus sp. CRU_1_1]NJR45199.1 zinc-binding dehydrogenase [Hyellaceae cyanobacterium CSU_1_1]
MVNGDRCSIVVDKISVLSLSTMAAQRNLRCATMIVQPKASLLSEIANSIDRGQVKIDIGRVFPLAEARQAQELSQQGHTRGKIVLQAIAQ